MSDAELVLGVDAGNSKTVAVVADLNGCVRGHGRAGNGDIYGAVSEQAAVDAVFAAVDTALVAAVGVADHTVLRHASFCLAGLDWDSDHAFWDRELTRRYPGLSRTLHNDGFALLRAGAADGIGVAISVGTGGAVVARGPGREWSASFWIRDPLGGTALGYAAFDAVIRAELGIGPSTSLTRRVLSHLGHDRVEDLLEATTSRGVRPPTYAALARDVLDAAAGGDEVAGGIVGTQARTLARYAAAAADRAGLPAADGFAVILGGSVLSSERRALRDATVTALQDSLPAARPHVSRVAPVLGAVAEAAAEISHGWDGRPRQRLTGHRFPAEFLLT